MQTRIELAKDELAREARSALKGFLCEPKDCHRALRFRTYSLTVEVKRDGGLSVVLVVVGRCRDGHIRAISTALA